MSLVFLIDRIYSLDDDCYWSDWPIDDFLSLDSWYHRSLLSTWNQNEETKRLHFHTILFLSMNVLISSILP